MPIEFRCEQCSKLLRVGDETAGKQAKCPSCGAVVIIPLSSQLPSQASPGGLSSAGSNPFGSAPTPPPPGSTPPGPPPGSSAGPNPFQSTSAGANPFATPGAGSQPYQPTGADFNPYSAPSSGGVGFEHGPATFQRTFQPTPVELGEIFGRTTEIYKQQLGMLVVGVLIMYAATFGFNFITGIIVNVLQLGMQNARNRGGGPEAMVIITSLAIQFIQQVFQLWLSLGLTKFMLNVARGGAPDVADIFKGGRYLLQGIAIYFLIFLGTFFGLLLLIVPGILLGLLWTYSITILIDREPGIIDSLRLSWQMSSVNMLNIFVMYLSLLGLGILGVCPGLCIGMLFTMSYGLLLFAVGYLMMSGQLTAAQWTPTYPQSTPQIS
jgi:phage FluMu protein Com